MADEQLTIGAAEAMPQAQPMQPVQAGKFSSSSIILWIGIALVAAGIFVYFIASGRLSFPIGAVFIIIVAAMAALMIMKSRKTA
jgi:membrane protein YdbS with pleckstrin-like domain